jgi:hypothetical protein
VPSTQPLNNVTTADGYTDANTIVFPGIRRLRIQVSTAAVLYQTADPTYGLGGPVWAPERALVPGLYGLNVPCNGVRVRSLKAGSPAQVNLDFVAGS